MFRRFLEVFSVIVARELKKICKTGLSNQCLYSLFALLEFYREKLNNKKHGVIVWNTMWEFVFKRSLCRFWLFNNQTSNSVYDLTIAEQSIFSHQSFGHESSPFLPSFVFWSFHKTKKNVLRGNWRGPCTARGNLPVIAIFSYCFCLKICSFSEHIPICFHLYMVWYVKSCKTKLNRD